MLKLILNEDFVHAIDIDNYNQSTVLNVDHYSSHQTSASFTTRASSVSNIMAFENVKITSLRIRDEAGETITNLSLNDGNMYLLNYNTNIYVGGQNTNVTIGQVNIPEQPEEEGEGEGE